MYYNRLTSEKHVKYIIIVSHIYNLTNKITITCKSQPKNQRNIYKKTLTNYTPNLHLYVYFKKRVRPIEWIIETGDSFKSQTLYS